MSTSHSHSCKCYDIDSDFVLWINDGLHILDLKRNESELLAQLFLELSSDDNFHNSPQIELDHINRKVFIKKFINIEQRKKETTKQYSNERKYIKSIAEYEMVERVMIFKY